jgi:Flp pilus assembly protein TadG
MKTKAAQQQEGFVLVMVALTLVILVGFVALGVDTGVLYSARTSAQEVADAAALAGAYTYISNPSAADPKAIAEAHATQIAVNNTILGKAVVSANVTALAEPAKRRVTVTVSTTQNTYFARAIFAKSADITVTAIAEAGLVSPGATGVRPWFIPNTVFAPDICGSKCDTSTLLIDPTTKMPTAFSDTVKETEFILKPGDPDKALDSGDFFLIDLGNGVDEYKDNIVYGAPTYLACLNTYPVMPGDKVGLTKQGVTDLIGGNPTNWFWQDTGEYVRRSDGKVFDQSPNVILAPIWDVCTATDFCPGKINGNATVNMVGWATLFLEDTVGKDVQARLISVSGCGTDPGIESGSSVLGLPLRLIRTS